ncbi:hypothetical protein B0E49_16355 [Polaromonas sp. C04]|nr:hypothetical protein B0E49_16355 [Polaromonas sp. C04]
MTPHELAFEACDVLVLGAGVAAYQATIAAARIGARVTLVGHAKGASPYILGFNVPLGTGVGDSAAQFAADTAEGGYHLGKSDLINVLALEAEQAYTDLRDLGVPFEMLGGEPALRHLSGSKFPRSVYVRAGTGAAIHKALVNRAAELGIERRLGLKVLSLVRSEDRVIGAIALNQHTGKLSGFGASSTVLALGGIGGLYGDSTYPSDIVGDSYALALDVGGGLVDMEFVQFEPTVVAAPTSVRGMEMPTAMLGDGATLVNSLGERFMCRYNPGACEKQIEKARMALCIQSEIDEGRGTDEGAVWFDATHLREDCLRSYVTHYRRLVGAGIDPARQAVQVKPVAHSLMGGVKIDAHCRSGAAGLYVCGEAAGGVHGASRIAGNGASDAIIFGRVAGREAATEHHSVTAETFLNATRPHLTASAAIDPDLVATYLTAIRRAMSAGVGIRRSNVGLQSTIQVISAIHREISTVWNGSVFNPLAPARSAAMVGLAIAHSALLRQESRGAHFRTDFPELNDSEWRRSIEVRLVAEGRLVTSVPTSNLYGAYEQATA